MYEYEIDIVSL